MRLWPGRVRPGAARHGVVGLGTAWHGMDISFASRLGTARHGSAGPGRAGLGMDNTLGGNLRCN